MTAPVLLLLMIVAIAGAMLAHRLAELSRLQPIRVEARRPPRSR